MAKSSHGGGAAPSVALLALPLAFAAGQVDGIAYLHLQIFVANLTGTVVLLGIAAAQHAWAPLIPSLASIAGFLAGVTAARLLRRRTSPAAPLAAAAGAVLAVGLWRPPNAAAIAALAAAMGLQTGALQRFFETKLSTAFITGDLSTLGEAVAAAAWREAPPPRAARPILLISGIVTCYAAGACSGAILLRVSTFPLAAAAAILLAVAGLSLRAGRDAG